MMRTRRDARVNAGIRPDARRGMYLKAVMAATKQLRVGFQLAGARMKNDSGMPWEDPDTRDLRTIYGEAAVGFELPHGRRWLGGVMALFGGGATESIQAYCRGPSYPEGGCKIEKTLQQFDGHYLRLGAQGHIGLQLGAGFHIALGFSPVWVRMYAKEIDFEASEHIDDLVALEPFLVARYERGRFSLELQPRASFLVGADRDEEGDRLATDPRFFLVFSLGLRAPTSTALPPREGDLINL